MPVGDNPICKRVMVAYEVLELSSFSEVVPKAGVPIHGTCSLCISTWEVALEIISWLEW